MSKERIENHAEKWKMTQELVRTAVNLEVDAVVPRGYSPANWDRARNIIGSYVFNTGSALTLTKVGEKCNLGPERTRQIKRDGILQLREHLPDKIKKRFPVSQLAFRKPLGQKAEKLTSDPFGRVVFDSKEVGVSMSRREKTRTWEKKLKDPNVSSQKAQRILGQLPLRFFQERVTGENQLFVSLTSLLRMAGIEVAPKDRKPVYDYYRKLLRDAEIAGRKIPFTKDQRGHVVYRHFHLSRDADKAVKVLRATLAA